MTIDEVLRVVHQGKVLGCTEVLFSLGDKPEAIYPEMKDFLAREGYQRTLSYLYEACRAVLEETELLPHSNPGVMGRADLRRLKEVNVSMGIMLENISERLMLGRRATLQCAGQKARGSTSYHGRSRQAPHSLHDGYSHRHR